MATQDDRKRAAAEAALAYIEDNDIVGVGTGSTANHFIDALAGMKARIDGAVASSDASAARLRSRRADVCTPHPAKFHGKSLPKSSTSGQIDRQALSNQGFP